MKPIRFERVRRRARSIVNIRDQRLLRMTLSRIHYGLVFQLVTGHFLPAGIQRVLRRRDRRRRLKITAATAYNSKPRERAAEL